MPTKRQVLDLLSRDELLALVDAQDVIVGDRRIKGHLVDRLVEKAPAVPELLARCSRDRLKELCRALGVADGGKEKAPLLARLDDPAAPPSTGPASDGQLALLPVAAPAAVREQPRPARARSVPTPVPPSPRSFGSFREITDFLWTNAERLRGAYRPNEYDNVILPFPGHPPARVRARAARAVMVHPRGARRGRLRGSEPDDDCRTETPEPQVLAGAEPGGPERGTVPGASHRG